MKTVTNKTRQPLSVPLPGGKKLHLGPGKTGQISSKAGDDPRLKALVDAGTIEILDEHASGGGSGDGHALRGSINQRGGVGGIRRSGDR